jgi:urea transport system ATP-binding protein
VRRLNAQLGISVLFVEQNIDMILSMAHRCYVMDKGRIVDEVAPQHLSDAAVVRKYLAV